MPPRKKSPPAPSKKKPPFDPDEAVYLQVKIKAGTRRKIHTYASAEGVTVSNVVDEAIVDYLTRKGFKL